VVRHQLDGVVQVVGFEHQNTAELFFGLGIRPIGDRHLAVLSILKSRHSGALERFPASKMAVSSAARHRK
jgi:hypothetical protein